MHFTKGLPDIATPWAVHFQDSLAETSNEIFLLFFRNASLHEQTFLKAVLAEFRRSGLEEATVQEVHFLFLLCKLNARFLS